MNGVEKKESRVIRKRKNYFEMEGSEGKRKRKLSMKIERTEKRKRNDKKGSKKKRK